MGGNSAILCRGMDVKNKFKLNMTTLVIIVIVLSILVYLSATSGPVREEPAIPIRETEPEKIPDTSTTKNQSLNTPEETVSENQQASPEKQTENRAAATITLSDNQVPEKQVRRINSIDTLEDDTAQYTVRIHASWSERLHPQWYPQGAHLSPMVAWSHRLKNILLKENTLAGSGIEIMAETGAPQKLTEEIQENIRTGTTLTYSTGSVFNAPGEDETDITMMRNAPYITVVSMIAPSPDWFIAARNIQLYENGRWLDRVSIPAVLYDAGTDSGTTFTAGNDDTNPQDLITKITNAPSIPIASFEFIKN